MSGQSIFITGAASGIGKATASLFAEAGWRVGLCDIDAGRLADVATRLGNTASVHLADVCDPEALSVALEAFARHGGLDVMFNCAGILAMCEFADCSLEAMHRIVDVNVNGVINGIHLALPHLRKRTDPRVISMSSVAAIHGIPEEAVYSASKTAVRALTEALNIELEPAGIWVCDLMVAYVATPMVLAAQERAKSVDILGVNVAPEQVAQTVWKAVHDRQVHWFVTPEDAAVAAQVDVTPWEQRRDIIKQITGFA